MPNLTIFDPRDLGARADGHAKDTAAVQAAIDKAAALGGTVRLAGGVFVCGTLYLKSIVTLEVTASATLLASPDMADYSTNTHHNRYRNEPCLLLENLHCKALHPDERPSILTES